MSDFLEIALCNAARGWYVLPLKPSGKIPISEHGKNDATLDEAEIRDCWSQVPAANVGISCGPSGLCVLDVDHGLKDEANFIAWRDRNRLPATYTVRSGRRFDDDGNPEFGVQSYYLGPIKDGKFELDGVRGEIKSAGGLVLAAGCIHPDSKEEYYVLVDAPLALRPDVIEKSRKGTNAQGKREWNLPVHDGDGRDDFLMSMAGKARDLGQSENVIRAYLADLNADPTVMADPKSEADLDRIAKSAARYDVPALEPKIIIGRTMQPEPAPLAQRNRPTYPVEVWEGTAVGEFAKLCAEDNNIPRKIYAESFRCALGAVVGDRISCPVEGALPRSYTIIVAPKGKGKGTGIRRAVRFFNQTWTSSFTTVTPGFLSGERDFLWKPKGIGAWLAAASSVPGMARLTKELKSTPPNKAWGNSLPRIFSVYEEMKGFLSTLFIEGGVGTGMEGIVCQLWDDVTFNGTATGTREAVYGEMLFSLLAGVTEEDWFDILSRGNAVGGGLMSRLNLIGTEGEYENVSKMKQPNFTALQETFLPRIRVLEDAHAHIRSTDGADEVISQWQDTLPEGSERMNVHAWRSALLLAWLRHEDAITAKTAEDAVRLGQYQVDSHDFYRVKAADTPNAKVQAKILRTLTMTGPSFKRELQQRTHAHRDGTELWNRALEGLVKDGALGKREDGAYYLAADPRV